MHRKFRFFFVIVLCICAHYAFGQVSADFKEKVNNLKWVTYSPTNYDPAEGKYPGEGSLRLDLETLIQHGFSGLVTYGSSGSLGNIPEIAQEVGFQGVIMGIWDIFNREEIQNAALAQAYVDGYCLGNEGLNMRYNLKDLFEAMSSLRVSTGKPVTTSEQIFDYAKDEVLSLGDWVFPNIHPFLSEVKKPEKAVRWIQGHYERLKKHVATERVILFKEVGFPTAGSLEATEKNQMRFFLGMEEVGVPFVYFEAFDQLWKTHLAVEPHWGLFDAHRNTKKFIRAYGLKK